MTRLSAAEQKVVELVAKNKSLSKDNQVLREKMQKMQSAKKGVMKRMDSERTMRLRAVKDRLWLKQKLEKLQRAISARLTMIGVDFSTAEDLSSALDLAFNVIQKLAKELQSKEAALEDATKRMEEALRRQNETETVLTVQIEGLESETKQLRADKEATSNQMANDKAALSQQRDDALRLLEDVEQRLRRDRRSVAALSRENEQIKEDNERLLNSKSVADAKMEEAVKESVDLRADLEALRARNKTLDERQHRLCRDLSRLKKLLQRASSLESELKNALDDGHCILDELDPGDSPSSQTSISSDDE